MTRADGDGVSDCEGTPSFIVALTGIRALAAAWVVLYHLYDRVFALLPATRALGPLMTHGFLGVDVFFVLSGFIISHTYAQRLAGGGRRDVGDFLLARFARLYPVHLLAILVTAALVAYAAVRGTTMNPTLRYDVLGFVGNLLMLQGLPGVQAWNIPSWSITCEAAAYLVFPLGAALLLRLRRGPALTLALVVVAVELAVIGGFVTLDGVGAVVAMQWLRIATEFALGCLLWAAWRHGVSAHWRWDAVVVLAVVAAGMILAPSPGLFGSFVAVPFLAVAVVATASTAGPVRAVLASRPLEWAGRVSYSWYLVHVPTLVVVFELLDSARFTSASVTVRVLVVVAYVAATLVVAGATHHLIEEPARRALRRRHDMRRSGHPVVGAPDGERFRAVGHGSARP